MTHQCGRAGGRAGGGSGADTTIDMSGAGGNDTDSAPPVVLDTLVTMVDCESFLHHFTEGSEARVNESAAFRKGEGASKKDSRNILDLLVDQIEVADVHWCDCAPTLLASLLQRLPD